MSIRSILFVCKANQCRSPSAEAVLRAMLAKRGAALSFEIDSAGTHDFGPCSRPSFEAHTAAHRRGYDMKPASTRRVMPGDFDRFDMILAMDRTNLEDLLRIAPTRSKAKIELLLEYGDRFHGGEIPDPVGGEATRFDVALEMIEDGCRGLVQLLVRAA